MRRLSPAWSSAAGPSFASRTAPLLLTFVSIGCAAGEATSALVKAPEVEGPKITLARTIERPLVVEWAATDRAALEARMRRSLVAVTSHDGKLELLPDCEVG